MLLLQNRIIFLSVLCHCILIYLLFYLYASFNFSKYNSHFYYGLNEKISDPQAIDEKFHENEDRAIADTIEKKIRILCYVLTGPGYYESRTKYVKETWGKRCTKILFMSSKADKSLPTIALPTSEGREYLWTKTRESLKYIYHHHINDYDWIYKGDDDTYVIIENLRFLLSHYNPNDPLLFGSLFKIPENPSETFIIGGPGYALSREAVIRFNRDAMPNTTICSDEIKFGEDVEITRCLRNVGVKIVNSRDMQSRDNFFYSPLECYLNPGFSSKDIYWTNIYYPVKQGMNCCSDTAIGFHRVKGAQMYVMEYLLYHIRPYGIKYNFILPKGIEEIYDKKNKFREYINTSLT